MSKNKSIFVTVATTEFEELIKAIDKPEIYEIFRNYGYSKIIFQIGRGKYKPQNNGKFEIEVYDFKPSLTQDYKNADLIFSHCGAGTLLECLQLQKKLCVVINDTLMDNHQLELFNALKEKSYIQGLTSPREFDQKIESVLQNIDVALKPFPKAQEKIIDLIIQQTF